MSSCLDWTDAGGRHEARGYVVFSARRDLFSFWTSCTWGGVAGGTLTRSASFRQLWYLARKGCRNIARAVGLSAGLRCNMESTKSHNSGVKDLRERAGTGSVAMACIMSNKLPCVRRGNFPSARVTITYGLVIE